MNNYPVLENNEIEKPKDNTKNIVLGYSKIKQAGNQIINNALTKKVNTYKSQLSGVPKIYTGMRNKLTLSNNIAKKNMEEHIANTGNHTASGYAISKRQNNNNEYQKELNNINIAEENQKKEIQGKIQDAYDEANEKSLEMNKEYDYKQLQDTLKETQRVDELNYKIGKENRDYALSLDKNKRDNEKHQMEMKYEPEIYQAKLDGMYKDNSLTDAKILKTNAETNKIKNSSYKSSSSGSSGSKTVNSKISAKDLAQSIREQAGVKRRDEDGKIYYDYENIDAYTYLMEWKLKFGISNQVINDAAIYLGIQDYL